jgi:hypothetical protein
VISAANPLVKLGHDESYHDFDGRTAEWVRHELLRWYDKNQRVLPWRMPSVCALERLSFNGAEHRIHGKAWDA